jgi:hypothetical protein
MEDYNTSSLVWVLLWIGFVYFNMSNTSGVKYIFDLFCQVFIWGKCVFPQSASIMIPSWCAVRGTQALLPCPGNSHWRRSHPPPAPGECLELFDHPAAPPFLSVHPPLTQAWNASHPYLWCYNIFSTKYWSGWHNDFKISRTKGLVKTGLRH